MAETEKSEVAPAPVEAVYGWVGEDEHGSGEVVLKQAMTPVGLVPLVAVREDPMTQGYLLRQLQAQADTHGKAILLCRFKFDGVIQTIEPRVQGGG